MASISSRDRKLLEQLVRDCIIYGLDEHESMEFMKKRAGGIPFSRSYYYAIKKRVSENESSTLQDRLTEHIRVGFALNHFKYIRSIENLQKILFQTLVDECSKTPEHRNLFAIARVSANMLQTVQFLRQLNIDTPFVNRMKAELDKVKKYKRLDSQKLSGWPESALVFDPTRNSSEASTGRDNEYDDTPVVE
jgi:hypothetical protein